MRPVGILLPVLIWAGFGLLLPAAASASQAAGREWRFAVTLDGSPIGEHAFRLVDRGDEIEVDSRASFNVRFLGFSVYSYEHHAKERWKGGCLASLESRTDDNGDIEVVKGELASEGFRVTQGGKTTLLPACTMTFAYWNPAMRGQSRLLNPQTGDYLDITIASEAEAKPGDGSPTGDAVRYVIRGKNLEVVLWYRKPDDGWLALDSRTSRGSLLSYRRRRDGRSVPGP